MPFLEKNISDMFTAKCCVEDLPPGAPHKRMPLAVEENLETAFEAYRAQYALDLSTSAIRSGL
jgi:hypothetical protein